MKENDVGCLPTANQQVGEPVHVTAELPAAAEWKIDCCCSKPPVPPRKRHITVICAEIVSILDARTVFGLIAGGIVALRVRKILGPNVARLQENARTITMCDDGLQRVINRRTAVVSGLDLRPVREWFLARIKRRGLRFNLV